MYESELGELFEAAKARNHRATLICNPAVFNSVSWTLESYKHGYYVCLRSPHIHIKTPGNSTVISFPTYRRLLGETVDYVVYEAVGYYDPNALAALSDTVRGGGVFFLLMDRLRPPIYHQFELSSSVSVLLPRFVHHVESRDLYASVEPSNIRVSANFDGHTANTVVDGFKSSDQRRVYRSALEWFSNGGDVLVLLSRRGRGKSALLGMILRELCSTGKIEGNVYVTSQSPTHLDTLLKHLVSPPKAETKSRWGLVVKLGGASVVFEPPDRVPPSSFVCVDEASTLPFSTLVNLISKSSIMILSTTNYGYEGSGKSFQTKLLNWISSTGRKLKVEELFEPVRYSANDPLEEAIARTFLFFADKTQDMGAPPKLGSHGSPQLRRLSALEMAEASDSELATLYSVLTEAHYRNEPRDLSLIIENLKTNTFSYSLGDQVVGVALSVKEERMSNTMVEAIMRGASFPGNLITERLTVRSLSSEFASLVGQRVVRIAVKPPLQGMGYGSSLLRGLEESFAGKCDWVGASFSADYRTVMFWYKNGYVFPAISWVRNPYSHAPSVICIKPLSEKARRVMRLSAHSLRAHIASHIQLGLLETRVYAAIVKSMADEEHIAEPSTALLNFTEWSLPAELIIPELTKNLFTLASHLSLTEVESVIRLIQWKASESDVLKVKASLTRILH
ncbi:MAG: GNAT family N-acetyltransferase [Thermoprotei archaeon]